MWAIDLNLDVARRRGFTLLEVLVALIVTSLFLTLLLPATLASVRRIEFSSSKNRALLLARAQMEAFSVRSDVSVGLTKGKEGGLAWEMEVSDAGNAHDVSAADISAASVVLRRLHIRVTEDKDALPLVEMSAQRLYVAR